MSGEMKAWQQGFDLALLRSIAQRFQQHDGPRCLGAFSKIKENTVAVWLAERRLSERPDSVVAYRWLRSKQQTKDFRGETVVEMPAGTLSIERVAGSAHALASHIAELSNGAPIIWRSWADHPEEQRAAKILALTVVGSLIRASSEIISIRARGAEWLADPLRAADRAGIIALPIASPQPEMLAALADWPQAVERLWIDHYSSYNKRQSWHAVALRSFGGDPGFIEKPAEMSRRYQQEHPERLGWQIGDTPLMDALPMARALLASLPAPLERVRLMRLTGGGELSRHADITDRAAGTRDGAIARLHLPIVTHPSVRFTTWDLANIPSVLHMEAGRWWYLDVRKPHMAENPSGFDRIHLVADCVVTPALRDAISRAA